MYDTCAYCPYSSQATDSTGHDYFQCELDDNPDNYPSAQCSSKGGNDGLYKRDEKN